MRSTRARSGLVARRGGWASCSGAALPRARAATRRPGQPAPLEIKLQWEWDSRGLDHAQHARRLLRPPWRVGPRRHPWRNGRHCGRRRRARLVNRLRRDPAAAGAVCARCGSAPACFHMARWARRCRASPCSVGRCVSACSAAAAGFCAAKDARPSDCQRRYGSTFAPD